MRKPLLLAATAAAMATMLMAGPTMASAATAAAAKVTVLTYGKVKGTNVSAKAVLSAGLKPKTDFTLTFGDSVTIAVTCTQATLKTEVTKDPARPGSAVTAATSLTVPTADCTGWNSQVPGVALTVTSLTFKMPGVQTTFSDAKGLPVKLAQPVKSTSNPAIEISLSLSAPAPIGAFSCSWAAAKLSGHYSDTGPLLALSSQVISSSLPQSSPDSCPPVSLSQVQSGPVNDASVKGSPHLYVN